MLQLYSRVSLVLLNLDHYNMFEMYDIVKRHSLHIIVTTYKTLYAVQLTNTVLYMCTLLNFYEE